MIHLLPHHHHQGFDLMRSAFALSGVVVAGTVSAQGILREGYAVWTRRSRAICLRTRLALIARNLAAFSLLK
jgi:hypothetical protein